MSGTPTSSDALRLLAAQMLEEARDLRGHHEPVREALSRAYRASLDDFATPEQILGGDESIHPATDLWMLAYLVALGALQVAEGRWAKLGGARSQFNFAVGLLQAESDMPKQPSPLIEAPPHSPSP